MKDPRTLSIKDFTYSLPEEKIAKYPLAERDSSKLLIYKNGNISESIYRKIDEYIPANSLLVFNNTKVVEARLLFQKPSGGIIEIFCLEPDDSYPDVTSAMMQQEKVLWKCLIGGASKWKNGQLLEKKIKTVDTEIILIAKYVEKQTDSFIVELSWQPASLSFAELLNHAGAIPLPPYIKRNVESSDKERYQTVYAEPEGSVAAPTAGLHFTKEIFDKLASKGIQKAFVTLHVGAGTFKPVKADTMNEHEMHSEFIDVSKEFIQTLLANIDNTIIATGTTSLRTIESLYWLGVKVGNRQYAIGNRQSAIDNKQLAANDSQLAVGSWQFSIEQWEPYELQEQGVSTQDALQSLLDWMEASKTERLIAKTKIIIAPGYKLRIAKALITNFHQPQSTLLLLVAALIGDDWRKVYEHALENDFRFLSYGDGSLLYANEHQNR